jgi:hypothetical protein
MDWFVGKFNGKIYENLWFPVNFPLNQSIEWMVGTLQSSRKSVYYGSASRNSLGVWVIVLGNPCDNACGWWILWEMMDVTEGRSHQS